MKHLFTFAHLHDPKHPDFGLVVLFAGVAFIVVFLLAYLVLGLGGKNLLPQKYHPHPTSYVLPSPSQTVDA